MNINSHPEKTHISSENRNSLYKSAHSIAPHLFAAFGILHLAVGGSLFNNCISLAFFEAERVGLYIVLMMVYLCWVTDRAFAKTRARGPWWFAASAVASATLLTLDFHDVSNCVSNSSEPFFQAWKPVAALLSIAAVGRFLMIGFGHANRTSAVENLHEWGEVASLTIMIMALFAFGLHEEHGAGGAAHLVINWKEVPAILIVYVLAELGIRIVVESKKIKEEATATLNESRNIVEETKKLVEKSSSIIGDVATISKSFQEISSIKSLIRSGLIEDSSALCQRFGLSKESPDYWDTISDFLKPWQIRAETPHTQHLLRILFEQYIGKSSDEGGSVRMKIQDDRTSLALVTADSIYSRASRLWLDEFLKLEMPIEVWAVSKLLPPHFAFPQLMVEPGHIGDSRADALGDFVGAVMNACHGPRKDRISYRRVTVFDENKRDLFEHFKSRDYLDTWFIFDGRRLSDSKAATNYFDPLPILKKHGITYDISNIQGDNADASDQARNIRRRLMLEDRTINQKVKDKKFLDVLVVKNAPSALAAMNISRSTQIHQVPDGSTVRSILEKNGWMSLGQWYCESLHTDDQAFWAKKYPCMDQCSCDIHTDELYRPLELRWNGTTFLTLDVLLIGTRLESDKPINWHGAIISNLDLSRTECTIQLKTDTEDLKNIETVVAQLCSSQHEGDPHYGKWANFGIASTAARSVG